MEGISEYGGAIASDRPAFGVPNMVVYPSIALFLAMFWVIVALIVF